MKSKATLKQIAAELHVSVSTVSKALNDSPEISEQTKIKVKVCKLYSIQLLFLDLL